MHSSYFIATVKQTKQTNKQTNKNKKQKTTNKKKTKTRKDYMNMIKISHIKNVCFHY